MRRRILGVAALCGGLLWLAVGVASAGGGGGAICDGFASGSELVMRDSCFEGSAHFVDAGSTLTVRNDGEVEHDLTAVDGSLETDLLEPGEEATVEGPDSGALRIYCTLHGTKDGSGMAGVLIAGQGDLEAAAPAAAESGSLWRPLLWWSGAVAAGAGLGLVVTRTARRRAHGSG